MSVDMFIKMDDFFGESQDRYHKDEIEVLSFSWGVSQSGSISHGGGGGEGKASFTDFSFSSHLQKSSPKLWLACATGRHIKEAVLSVRKAGQQNDFYKVTLQDVIVSSFNQGGSEGSEDDRPSETISLNFAKIRTDYTFQNAKGTGELFSAEFDTVANTDG